MHNIAESVYEMAYQMAWHGKTRCASNPSVAAIIVWKGHVLARGVTGMPGHAHAEAQAFINFDALYSLAFTGGKKKIIPAAFPLAFPTAFPVYAKAGWRAVIKALDHNYKFAHGYKKHILKSCTLVLTLSPCTFQGKTPACLPQVLNSGMQTVVLAHDDPHPKVWKKSIAALKRSGIAVLPGFPKKILQKLFYLNYDYFFKILFAKKTLQNPLVVPVCITIKLAATLDGKTATSAANSQWITSNAARSVARSERLHYNAVLVGGNTFFSDNPKLSAHGIAAKQIRDGEIFGVQSLHWHVPTPVVLFLKDASTSELKAMNSSYLFKSISQKKSGQGQPLFVFLSSFRNLQAFFTKNEAIPTGNYAAISSSTAQPFAQAHAKETFYKIFRRLQALGLYSIYCEGGSGLAGILCRSGMGHRFSYYLAPKILADPQALDMLTPKEYTKVGTIKNATRLQFTSLEMVGEDACLQGVFMNAQAKHIGEVITVS